METEEGGAEWERGKRCTNATEQLNNEDGMLVQGHCQMLLAHLIERLLDFFGKDFCFCFCGSICWEISCLQ